MTDIASNKDWRSWTLELWNDKLFDHYFRASSKNTAIRRIPITDDELRKIVGSNDADPNEIRRQFLQKIRSRDVESSLRLSHWKRVWNEVGRPPFFAYLFLTCLAASGDEETADVGNFRSRLNEMLTNDIRYMLPQLSMLWEYLADRLVAEHEKDPSNAFLILPDPGNEVRIGYSKRLAFPSQRDKNRLVTLFHRQGITRQILVPQILRLLDGNIERFSSSFKSDFEDFHAKYARGKVNLEKSHFWSAVLHAISESQQVSMVDIAAVSLVLLADSVGDNRLFVLVDSPDLGITLSEARTFPARHDHSKHVLQIGRDAEGIDTAVELLLAGELHDHLPLVKSTVLRTSVSQGVLLFGADEHGIHEFQGSMPSSGSVQLLMRAELAKSLASMCAESSIRISSRPSRYDGWFEIFDVTAETLRQIDFSQNKDLASAHCLQAPRKIYRIGVRSGVRSGRAFLGYQECLPEIRAIAADMVTLSSLSPIKTVQPIALEHVATDEDFVFAFPKSTSNSPLEGRYRITARDREGVLSTSDLTFRLTTIGTDYKIPNSGTYRVESGIQSTVLFSVLNRLAAAHNLHKLEEANEISNSDFQSKLEFHKSESPIAIVHTEPVRESVRRTEEICASIAINQSGIKPVTILNLIESNFSGLNRWDVLRAWVEAGHFDQLTSTTGLTTYVPRRPRINYSTQDSEHLGTVTGLTTFEFRERLRVEASSLGCEVEEGLSFTPCLLGPILIRSHSRNAIANLAKSMDVPFLSERMEWAQYLKHVAVIATQNQQEQVPLNYNFSRVSWRSRDNNECSVIRHQRLAKRNGREYRESQDYFVVVQGSHEFWTYSRNWAMLTAMSLTDQLPFCTTTNHCIARQSHENVYMPLPVGRLCAIVASAVGGPLPQGQSNATYVYPVLSKTRLATLHELLFGQTKNHETQVLAVVNSHRRCTEQRSFELPRLVKKRLIELSDSPNTRLLVKGKVSSSTFSMACRLVNESHRKSHE